ADQQGDERDPARDPAPRRGRILVQPARAALIGLGRGPRTAVLVGAGARTHWTGGAGASLGRARGPAAPAGTGGHRCTHVGLSVILSAHRTRAGAERGLRSISRSSARSAPRVIIVNSGSVPGSSIGRSSGLRETIRGASAFLTTRSSSDW